MEVREKSALKPRMEVKRMLMGNKVDSRFRVGLIFVNPGADSG